MIEYRVCWSASSNITFHGSTDWWEWDIEGESAADVETALSEGAGYGSLGLAEALEASGFEWWVETKPADAS